MELEPLLKVVLLAAAPVSELRGAIPYGILAAKLPVVQVFAFSFFGNILPVIPLFFGIRFLLNGLTRFRYSRKFALWFIKRTKKKAKIIEYYQAVGLALFVAIPLPMTGAWTGIIAASLFKIKFKYAFLAVMIGVLIAGLVVTGLTLSGSELFNLLYKK